MLMLVFPSSSAQLCILGWSFHKDFSLNSYHLFLARGGISELALGSEKLFKQNLVLLPPFYPGEKTKTKERNKGISCAFKMTFLADGDEYLYTVFEHLLFSSV